MVLDRGFYYLRLSVVGYSLFLMRAALDLRGQVTSSLRHVEAAHPPPSVVSRAGCVRVSLSLAAQELYHRCAFVHHSPSSSARAALLRSVRTASASRREPMTA